MTDLRISPDLSLPVDAVTQAIAILARKGAGKTYTASVIVEEVIRAKVPVVILDPTGAWWGLRTSADGDKPGLPVVIFGGDHGDVPLEPTAGQVVADVVVQHPGAYVVDLSGFPSRASEQRFAGDFLERLYRAKKAETGPLLLVVDEADMFAPQRPGPEQTRTLGALEAIVRRGRIKGLGDLLITQRAAVLNKNVLTQTEVLVVMQTTGPQDRAAIDAWIEGNGTREERDEVLGSLASMQRGEAWVWSPSFLRILKRVRIRTRTTFDSSRTPEAGEVAVVPRAFASVDLEKLGARIAATVEKAKADDPRELRRRITELERSVQVAETSKPETVVERIEVPVLNGQVDDLREIVGRLSTIGEGMVLAGTGLTGIADSIVAAIDRVSSAPRSAPQSPEPRPVQGPGRTAAGRIGAPSGEATPRTRGVEAATVRDLPQQAAGGAPNLGRAERTVLNALAQSPAGLTKVQLSLLSGYSIKSSALPNALGALRSLGLVTKSGEPIEATPEGIAAAGDVEPFPAPGPELVAYWSARLGKAERAVLDVLVAAFPADVGREEISAETGYSLTSSALPNALGRLRSLKLVDGWRASPDLVGGS